MFDINVILFDYMCRNTYQLADCLSYIHAYRHKFIGIMKGKLSIGVFIMYAQALSACRNPAFS